MMKSIFQLMMMLAFFQTAQAQTFNPALAAMLQDTLDTYANLIGNIKGISTSVYLPGQGIWQGAAKLSYAGQPITTDMEFGIASNSKLFASTAMLILAEDGIISLDDSLHEWLPAYPNVDPDITIRQLLNHKSGISDPIFVSPWMDTIMANPNRVFTPLEVLSWLQAPFFAKGTSWGYSNVNYILAGMIAQNATGFHISKIIRDSILVPLNMDSTFYDVEEPVFGTLAHRWFNNVDYHNISRVGLNTAGGVAGSIFSNSSEMAQWYHALFSGQILNPASLSELTTFVATSNPNQQYGLGLARETTQGLTYWTHGGDTWGYKSKMMYDPCLGTVVCGLSNSFPSGMTSIPFLLYRVVKNHVPGCSGAIVGLNVVNQGQNAVTYTVPPIPNATSYSWTLPSGAIGVSNTNSITVDFGVNAVSGNIMVSGVNNFGAGGTSTLFITVIPVVLSVEFANPFNAYQVTEGIQVEWATASEANCAEFEVERSANSLFFEKIAHTSAYGNTSEYHLYKAIDKQPLEGTNYYRIKEVDFDGTHHYSQILTAQFEPIEINIYPNPSNGVFSIESNTLIDKIEVINILGNVVAAQYKPQNTIDIADLPNGIYTLKILDINSRVFIERIIKK